MKKVIKAICNFIVTISLVIFMIYISLFTDIPSKIGNTIKYKIEEYKTEYIDYSNEFQINELGIRMNDYYYNKLSDGQKIIYTSIANAVKNFQSEFAVRNYVTYDKDEFASEVAIAISAFINDHPEVFYLKSQYSSYIVSGFNGSIGYIRLNYTEDTMDAVNEKLQLMKQKVDEYVQKVEGLSEFDKELNIHDLLAKEIVYSDLEELPRAYHTIEGTLIEGTGVCDSFTKSLQIIYDKAGIDSIIVLGTLDGNPHAWNLVNIDDEWYHVDITSSRSIYDETGIVNHAYFNLTDENLLKVCTIDTPEILPKATATKYNYYNYNNFVIREDEFIDARLREIYQSFVDKNYIEFYIYGKVSDNIASVLVTMRSIDSNFLNGSKMSYYDIQNAVIIPRN